MATVIERDEQRSVERKELPDGKKFHVFISYSESDRLWVGTVIQHLQNDYNFKCFEHSADFIPGMKITENIEYAMSNSAKTMFILTEDYNKSYWCQYEVEFAILKLLAEMKENVIIPVLKEECEIPGYLRPFTYINGTGDMNVWLPKLALAIEAEGQQYNHELSLNRVRDAVNRNRNLDLLHEEKSHFSCKGPVFRWKYVPESLSVPPMQVSSELYNDIIKNISSKHLVLGRHCRNIWWPVIYCVLTIALPSLGFGIAIWATANFQKDNPIMVTAILFVIPAVALLWLAGCGCSEYWNHLASELHNKRIRENQNCEMVSLNANDNADDDEALLDNTIVDSVTCDVQETVTNYLLELSSAYLQDYMNEKLEHAGDNNRHATKAKCICQFAESLEFAEMQIV
ncbi:Hypothetical predicted protein [Mytilus galloprovincialis]|uniref:TIR domain-containing protein n=1 Tax=Mytilus galloprovincialis TaxID=29158 RepID=A0A8B6DNG9_MYTGA|nr:Hypothetical predicted protein [Mytilus galloprovincialis]